VNVKVHIGPKAVDAVRKTGRLAVVATITVRDAAAKATRTMRVTLTMPRRR
jgi:hypothetical protein